MSTWYFSIYTPVLIAAIVVQADGKLHFMTKIYGFQSIMVMKFLGVCFIFAIVCCCCTCGGLGYKVNNIKSWGFSGTIVGTESDP